MTASSIKISDTRFPVLTRAVLASVDRESLVDVCNQGADCGFGSFVYYVDTCEFFKKHRKDIMAIAESMAQDFGQDLFAMIAGFGCLKDYKLGAYETSEALNGRGEMADQVQNAMAWFALEEVARELNPDL